jgi:hypothetical protein
VDVELLVAQQIPRQKDENAGLGELAAFGE